MSRSEITIWYWKSSTRAVSDFSNDLHTRLILYCVLKSVSPRKRKSGPLYSASDLFTEGMMFLWLLDTSISHTCHGLSYRFLSHLWEAVCYPSLFLRLILPGRHPGIDGYSHTETSCVGISEKFYGKAILFSSSFPGNWGSTFTPALFLVFYLA